MQQITSSDFSEWKSNPVTKCFYMAISDRIEEAKEVLSNQAGISVNEDNFLRGFIRAYREALMFRVDDLEEVANGD